MEVKNSYQDERERLCSGKVGVKYVPTQAQNKNLEVKGIDIPVGLVALFYILFSPVSAFLLAGVSLPAGAGIDGESKVKGGK